VYRDLGKGSKFRPLPPSESALGPQDAVRIFFFTKSPDIGDDEVN
jgi:hypothetical protein